MNHESAEIFAILATAVVYDFWHTPHKIQIRQSYVCSFSNDTKRVCVGKYAFKVGLRVIHVATSAQENPSEFHENVSRLSHRENRLSTLGIPFRFLKYTASEYRERNVSTISIAYAHNADCPFVPFSTPFTRGERKKEEYSHAASGASSV